MTLNILFGIDKVDRHMSNIDFQETQLFYSTKVQEARRFFIHNTSQKRSGLVICGGFERVQADYVIDRASLDMTAVEYVARGRGTAYLAGGQYELFPGVMFTYDERSPHRIETDPAHPLEKYFVDLRGRAGREVIRRHHLAINQAWYVDDPTGLRRLFDELLYHGAGSRAARQAVCDTLLKAILFHAAPRTLLAREDSRAYETYQRCCQIIDADASRLRSLADVAERSKVDPAYICRLFKRFAHDTPYRRLVRKRMEIAAARLYSTNVLIRSLAEEMGQTDAFNFSRQFKSVFDMSPSQFRASYLGLNQRSGVKAKRRPQPLAIRRG
ncbi:AraC family transcriptional regulator [soil metagenome]